MSISTLKNDHAFLDETYAVSSYVRDRTEVSFHDSMNNLFIPAEERVEIEKRMQKIRRRRKNFVENIDGQRSVPYYRPVQTKEYDELLSKLSEANSNLRMLSNNLKYVYPLTPKTIIQYRKPTYQKVVKFFNQLPAKEQAQFYVIRGYKLSKFEPNIIPRRQVELRTSLKPYYSKESYHLNEVEAELQRTLLKLKNSAINATKAGQNARVKAINYKVRKLAQISSIVSRLNGKYLLYGKILKGVKCEIEINGISYIWPKYLLGNFSHQSEHWYNHSLLNANTVSYPKTLETFPILEVDKYHLFCEESIEALQLRKGLSDHIWRKFRPFSHYEMKLSKEYPQKNSTGFPYEYFR
tara:strand:- start:691 stop:1749 length:1059 start_codon:yes stop_codon:yes gene_type:complete